MPMGRVRFGGVVKTVSLACVPDARVGQYVLVHAGIGIGVIDEAEAERVLGYLVAMGQAEESSP
jgi:hydrogenase expression/formation protein HypC